MHAIDHGFAANHIRDIEPLKHPMLVARIGFSMPVGAELEPHVEFAPSGDFESLSPRTVHRA